MKGKAAVQNANRRTTEALDRAAALERELTEVKATAKREADQLRVDIARLRRDITVEAGRIAADEVERQRRQAERETASAGMSMEVARHLMYQKDKFIMNACRYVSMRDGRPPMDVLPMVLAWCTDENFYGFGQDPVKWLTKIGVSPDGWTASLLTQTLIHNLERKFTRDRRRDAHPLAWSLDAVDDEVDAGTGRFPQVHPKYKTKWYPRAKYAGIEVVGEDADGQVSA